MSLNFHIQVKNIIWNKIIFSNKPSLYLFVYLRWIYQWKNVMILKIVHHWKTCFPNTPNFILFIKGWWTCSESTLHRLSFPAYFLHTDRPSWSARLGVQNFVWDFLAWLDCMDSVGWQESRYLAGFRSARKFYTRLEKAASWNRYPGLNYSSTINILKDLTLEIGINIWEKKIFLENKGTNKKVVWLQVQLIFLI